MIGPCGYGGTIPEREVFLLAIVALSTPLRSRPMVSSWHLAATMEWLSFGAFATVVRAHSLATQALSGTCNTVQTGKPWHQQVPTAPCGFGIKAANQEFLKDTSAGFESAPSLRMDEPWLL